MPISGSRGSITAARRSPSSIRRARSPIRGSRRTDTGSSTSPTSPGRARSTSAGIPKAMRARRSRSAGGAGRAGHRRGDAIYYVNHDTLTTVSIRPGRAAGARAAAPAVRRFRGGARPEQPRLRRHAGERAPRRPPLRRRAAHGRASGAGAPPGRELVRGVPQALKGGFREAEGARRGLLSAGGPGGRPRPPAPEFPCSTPPPK